jgi:hypothetical protein
MLKVRLSTGAHMLSQEKHSWEALAELASKNTTPISSDFS